MIHYIPRLFSRCWNHKAGESFLIIISSCLGLHYFFLVKMFSQIQDSAIAKYFIIMLRFHTVQLCCTLFTTVFEQHQQNGTSLAAYQTAFWGG